MPWFSIIRIDVRLQRTCPVDGSFRNHKSLSRQELNRPPFQIDKQLAVDNVKEFVVIVVLVPVILALNHAKPNHSIVYPAEGLVKPVILASVGNRLFINEL
jgi:hypothetical protein